MTLVWLRDRWRSWYTRLPSKQSIVHSITIRLHTKRTKLDQRVYAVENVELLDIKKCEKKGIRLTHSIPLGQIMPSCCLHILLIISLQPYACITQTETAPHLNLSIWSWWTWTASHCSEPTEYPGVKQLLRFININAAFYMVLFIACNHSIISIHTLISG